MSAGGTKVAPPGPGRPPAAGAAAAPPEGTGEARAAAATAGRLRAAGAVAALVLLLAGAGLLVRAQQLGSTPAADNAALTDAEATDRVIGDVSDALGRVFSYTPDGTGATAEDAGELLAGRAEKQYRRLFGAIRERVAEQRLTLTTEVVRAAVVSLDADDARLLVFLDQVTERAGDEPASAGAQLAVTAELRSGEWLITDMRSR